MHAFDWTCPYCNRSQAVTRGQRSREDHRIGNSGSEFGDICCSIQSIRCASEDCKKLLLTFSLHKSNLQRDRLEWTRGDQIQHWTLLPDSFARPQPDYIPRPLVDDYSEACRIRDLSPKASATLARRCLQGMIRDFCGVRERTLYHEIEVLRERLDVEEGVRHVQRDTVDAIDNVRQIGNIGAHMESNVNLIIDIDENEAQVLIELIEMLFEEWYVQREERRRKLDRLQKIAKRKKEQKSEGGE